MYIFSRISLALRFCFVRRDSVYARSHCYHSCGETQSGR